MSQSEDDSKGRAVRDPSGTIKRIIAAAREEFGANGYDGAKVEHIARRAGVSKQLVYVYFNGKDELYSELLKNISMASYNRLLKIDFDALDPEMAIRTYIAEIYDQYFDDPVMAVVTLDQSLHKGAQIRHDRESKRMRDQLWEKVTRALERGKKAGLFIPDVTMESLEFMTVIIVSGCVSSRGMFSRYIGSESSDQNSPEFWRNYALGCTFRAIKGGSES